ncbi:Sugar transport protein 5 [Glycine soja]|uniref:Sugar transport protein 5 n=1 Tax=Glycine soja TaxID=3848 RepID=A0A445K7N6_GLYSO|nr:Sugar transport protein 5 [Glycine soja]
MRNLWCIFERLDHGNFYISHFFSSLRGLTSSHSILLTSFSLWVSTIILGIVNLAPLILSTAIVDRFGQSSSSFLVAFSCLIFCQIAVSALLAMVTGVHGFGWSWGPVTWLIPSEIFPLRIRTTGQSIAVGVQFISLFALSQTFLTMLCHFKFGAFLFYAVWIAVMTLFIMFFLPETKGIPLESMYTIWGKQWFWRRFVEGAVKQDNFP